MVNIIRYGRKFSETCPACGCFFAFEEEDIKDIARPSIECPACGSILDFSSDGDLKKWLEDRENVFS